MDLRNLNQIIASAYNSMHRLADWEKQTPLVIVKRDVKKANGKYRVRYLGNLRYYEDWASKRNPRPKRVFDYDERVLEVRLLSPEVKAELDKIENEIKQLREKFQQILKDRFYDLELVEDEVVEKFHNERKRLFKVEENNRRKSPCP